MTSRVMAAVQGGAQVGSMLTRWTTVVPLCLAMSTVGCNAKRFVMTKAIEGQVDYFDHETSNSGLEQLTERVYTFSHHWERGIVIRTDEGLVVSDTFGPSYTRALLDALRRAGIDDPVHTVIYSHYHLDHVGGAAELSPTQILVHEDAPHFWAEAAPRELATPTRYVTGEPTLEIGGVQIELVDTSAAHSATLYALYLPQEGLLYAPDTLAPNVVLLGGAPAVPLRAYFGVMAKLDALPFETFVASHFGYGSKQDFRNTVAMLEDAWSTARTIFADYGWTEGNLHTHRDDTAEAFGRFYDELHQRYGDWHGFDQNILSAFVRLYTAELSGDMTASPDVLAPEFASAAHVH
ncbi:MAG: MBL fold metallo-hydrolase [Myxococcota bacterium]